MVSPPQQLSVTPIDEILAIALDKPELLSALSALSMPSKGSVSLAVSTSPTG